MEATLIILQLEFITTHTHTPLSSQVCLLYQTMNSWRINHVFVISRTHFIHLNTLHFICVKDILIVLHILLKCHYNPLR